LTGSYLPERSLMQLMELAQGSFLRLWGINTVAKARIKKVERKIIKEFFFWEDFFIYILRLDTFKENVNMI